MNEQSLIASDDLASQSYQWQQPYYPHRWIRGGWLQTVSVKLLRPELKVDSWQGTQLIAVADRDSNDVLTGKLLPTSRPSGKPAVILLHGMGGHAESGYLRSLAERLLEANYPVVLWNHRGAGSSAERCGQLHHPGRTDDLEQLIQHLNDQHCDWTKNGLCAIAVSLGANVLLRYLASHGRGSGLDACVAVSAPLDMAETSNRLRQGWNKMFDAYLLSRQQKELLRETADLTAQESKTIRDAKSVWELDDTFTGPRFGFKGAEDYYQANSAISVLDKITTPTLCLHAADDPVVTAKTFEQYEWAAGGPLHPLLTDTGGHIGFVARDGSRWHEQACVRFLNHMVGDDS